MFGDRSKAYTEVFTSTFSIELSIDCFCGKPPRGLIAGTLIDAAQKHRMEGHSDRVACEEGSKAAEMDKSEDRVEGGTVNVAVYFAGHVDGDSAGI